MTEGTIQSVERTFAVLECLAAHGEMGVRELHADTGLSVTTCAPVSRAIVPAAFAGYCGSMNSARISLSFTRSQSLAISRVLGSSPLSPDITAAIVMP